MQSRSNYLRCQRKCVTSVLCVFESKLHIVQPKGYNTSEQNEVNACFRIKKNEIKIAFFIEGKTLLFLFVTVVANTQHFRHTLENILFFFRIHFQVFLLLFFCSLFNTFLVDEL